MNHPESADYALKKVIYMTTHFTQLRNLMRPMSSKPERCPSRRLSISKKGVAALVALGVFTFNAPLPAATTATLPLLQKANLVYEGAFRVPNAGADYLQTFDYGGTALGFNSNNNSIFLTGHDWYQRTAELKIPAIVNSTNLNNLNTATLLQGFVDETEGKLASINSDTSNAAKIGGHLVYNNKLIVSGYSYYDAADTQSKSHFTRPLSLSTTGQVVGPYLVGSDPHYTDGYMTLIPPEWQASFGGPALTGMCCQAILSVQSNGPSVSVFDPSTTAQPAIRLLGYPSSNPLAPHDSQNAIYNATTRISGVIFPNGTRSVLFFGRHGTGPYCYGTGADCNDPADDSKGTHAYPYVYQVWAYDANDLLAVKNGTKQQYEPKPYAVWTFNLPFEDNLNMHFTGGAAYDPATNRIYLSQMSVDGAGPIIHVFKVQGGTTVTTLPPPSNLRVQ